MSDINTIVILGRLTRDGELKYLPNGTALLTASIANNQGYKKDDKWIEQVHYFDLKLWSKRAESLAQYLVKGTQIVIEGQLKQERWQNDAGQARSKVVINVNNLSFAGGKKTGNGQQAQLQGQGQGQAQGQAQEQWQGEQQQGKAQGQESQEKYPPPAVQPQGTARPVPSPEDFKDDLPTGFNDEIPF